MKFSAKDLVSQGIVKAKTYTEGPYAGLSVLKYSNSVFWGNRWGEDSRLLDCRGMVVDQDDNVIIWPFTKIFNRFENDTDLPLDQEVICVRKVNGFMATAALHKGELIVSTTGTLDSDFADLARKYLENFNFNVINFPEDYTFIFEICDNTDPHIVEEKEGAYLIGARDLALNGVMASEGQLDQMAEATGFLRPTWNAMNFGDVIENVKRVKHEGYVIRSLDTDTEFSDLLMKIKSPYYLTKKFFMRGGVKKCEAIWDHNDRVKQIVEEEYYPLVDYIKTTFTKDQWLSMNEQDRGAVIGEFLGED